MALAEFAHCFHIAQRVWSSCQSLYLNPKGEICCTVHTGRHISHPDNLVWHFAGERILELELEFLMSAMRFVSWRDIIGQVGLLYSGPLLYAGTSLVQWSTIWVPGCPPIVCQSWTTLISSDRSSYSDSDRIALIVIVIEY